GRTLAPLSEHRLLVFVAQLGRESRDIAHDGRDPQPLCEKAEDQSARQSARKCQNHAQIVHWRLSKGQAIAHVLEFVRGDASQNLRLSMPAWDCDHVSFEEIRPFISKCL